MAQTNHVQYKLEALTRPLGPNEIEWRITNIRNGWTTVVPYIEARTAMARFDEAFGPLNWQLTYREFNVGNEQGVVASISIRHPETNEWVTKEDGAEPTDCEAYKGGLSAALKRAAVPWGLGRELYRYPTVQIQGEHKYIPYKVIDRLNAMVRALNEGKHVPDLIRLTADGQNALRSA